MWGVVDEQDGEAFAGGAHGTGDAGGVAAVDDEVVIMLRHWIPLQCFQYSGWDAAISRYPRHLKYHLLIALVRIGMGRIIT